MNGTSYSTVNYPEICEEPKYSDLLHIPYGLPGYFDYKQGMSCAKKSGKPVLLDFNGHGCANCKKMEANVWSDNRVQKRLREDFIIISLYVDDKTELPENEWVTSTYDGKVKKTIGRINADFQISKFQSNGQPYYLILDHEGNKLVSPMAYETDPNKFIEFLENGKREFKLKEGSS